jgi:oligoribonuclease NrnB/cAMP/cGMP phosphodiesterase (DHH superfamily)
MANTVVLYHQHCTDGFAAAYQVWRVFGANADYIGRDYVKATDVKYFEETIARCKDKKVFILDWSMPAEYIYKLAEVALQTVLLDHHQTAFEYFSKEAQLSGFGDNPSSFMWDYITQNGRRLFIKLDNKKSGAKLAMDYFALSTNTFNNNFIVDRIDDRDRWVFQYPESRALHAFLNAETPWSFEQWDRIVSDDEMLYDGIQTGFALIKQIDVAVERMCRNAVSTSVLGVPAILVNSPIYQSEIGDRLYTKYKDEMVLVWYAAETEQSNCSMRSLPGSDIDVAAIAQSFGGGGHKHAAGCRIPTGNINLYLKQGTSLKYKS